ncbi:hypothetical protein RFI_37427, partial [Reticulomyxa filosa]
MAKNTNGHKSGNEGDHYLRAAAATTEHGSSNDKENVITQASIEKIDTSSVEPYPDANTDDTAHQHNNRSALGLHLETNENQMNEEEKVEKTDENEANDLGDDSAESRSWSFSTGGNEDSENVSEKRHGGDSKKEDEVKEYGDHKDDSMISGRTASAKLDEHAPTDAGSCNRPVVVKASVTKLPSKEEMTQSEHVCVGKHVFVLVHGYQGNSWDMRMFRNHLMVLCPSDLFLMSQANEKEEQTDGDIREMGQRLAQEI